MENPVHCPKCQSTHISLRDHEQHLKKIGGILMTSAGATAGTVGGAASGASIGAAIGALAGPLGFVVGGTVGTFVGAVGAGVTGGVIGNFLGKKVGVTVDRNLFWIINVSTASIALKQKLNNPQIKKNSSKIRLTQTSLLLSDPIDYSGCLTNSTRRFCAFPSTVEFVAIGCVPPKPFASKREGSIPNSISACTTACARCSDNFRLV